MKHSELKQIIREEIQKEMRFIPSTNTNIQTVIDTLIKVMGYKKYQLGVEYDMGVHWITLPSNALKVEDLDLLSEILPKDYLIGSYPQIGKGLSIKTTIKY